MLSIRSHWRDGWGIFSNRSIFPLSEIMLRCSHGGIKGAKRLVDTGSCIYGMGSKNRISHRIPWRKTIVACLETGQITCHDSSGRIIDCTGSGQDAEFRNGVSWPSQRFEVHDHTVTDQLTGLVWAKNANMAEFPLAWEEAFGYVAAMNRDRVFGFSDWRLPNRRELRSLMSHQTRKPALPEGHPFGNVREGYWSSTTSMFEPDWAWALYLTKGAVGVGQKKDEHFSVWAVCDPQRG